METLNEPGRQDQRLGRRHAAGANQNQLTVTAITPLLQPRLTLVPQPTIRPEGEGAEEASGQPKYPETLWKWFLRDQKLSDEQKSRLATQLAGALVKLDRLEEATRLWKIAAMLATDDSLRSKANGELERVQAQLKLEKADQERGWRSRAISGKVSSSGLA